MIVAPFLGPLEIYSVLVALGFTLHPILLELMSFSARVGPYFKPFLESILDAHNDEEKSFDSTLRTP